MTTQEQSAWSTISPVWRIIRRAFDDFSDDRIPSVAAAITFFFLLALFPAIACIASIYGMFADRSTIIQELRSFSGFLPGGAVDVLRTDLDRLAALPASRLNMGFFFSLTIALWSASGGVKALIEGLNVAYDVKETRSFLGLTLHAIGLTAIVIVSFTVAIEAAVRIPAILERFPYDSWLIVPFQIFVWPMSILVCAVLASLIYRYGPDRAGARWRWITWGGAIASVVWVLGTLLFTWYVRNFGSYNAIYGNLGAIVGFLTWIWLSVVVLLLGAEINAVMEREAITSRLPRS
jgi:membrane protein